MRVKTTDDSVVVYQDRDLSSPPTDTLPKDSILELGVSEETGGREWIEVTLENGSKRYVLGPSARGHTTLAATVQAPPSVVPKLNQSDTPYPAIKDARGWLFRDEDSARGEKDRWQNFLPKQKSAYHPSGKIAPIGALKLLTIGMLTGSLFTFIFALICTLVFGYGMAFTLHLGAFAGLVSVVALFGIGFVFTGPGLSAAAAVGSVARRLKNRNVLAEGLIAAASSIVGWIVFCRWCLPSVSSSLLNALPPAPSDGTTGTYLSFSTPKNFLFIMPIAFVVFVVFAFRAAAQRVRQEKFCEGCGEYMSSRRVGCLSLKQTLDFIAAAKEGQLADFSLEKHEGFAPAELTVCKCDTCPAGYAEISVNFRAAYLNERSRRSSISAKRWLAFSVSTACDLSGWYE